MLFEIQKLWRAISNNVSIEISPKIYHYIFPSFTSFCVSHALLLQPITYISVSKSSPLAVTGPYGQLGSLEIPKEILLEIWLNGHLSMEILLEMALQSFGNETMLVQYTCIVKIMT